MKITNDDLKRAFKSHIRSCVPRSREACPPPESIFSLFGDSVSPPDKEKVIDHITGCSYCLQEFELFLEFHRKEEKAIEDMIGCFGTKRSCSTISRKKSRFASIHLGARFEVRPLWRLAAASLFAIGITALFLVAIRSYLRTPKAEDRGRLPGQIRLISPVRGQEIRTPLVFRWEGTPRAEYYHLEIFDRSLLPLWKSPRLEGFCYSLPPESADILKANEIYFWTVTAWLMDGTTKESALEEFIARK